MKFSYNCFLVFGIHEVVKGLTEDEIKEYTSKTRIEPNTVSF